MVFAGFTSNIGSIELLTFDSNIQISDEGLDVVGDIALPGDDVVYTQEASPRCVAPLRNAL